MVKGKRRALALILALGLPGIAGGEASAQPAPITAPADPLAYHADRERAMALVEAARFEEAAPLLSRVTSAYPLDRATWMTFAVASRRLGRHRAAIDAYTRAIALGGPMPGNARYWTAIAHVQLGESDAALDALETMVFEDRDLDRPGLAEDPDLAPLRNDPRFVAIIGAVPAGESDRTARRIADLDHLIAEIRRLSPRYRDAPLPERTLALERRLRADMATLSDAELFARLSGIVGSLDQGHTMLWGAGPPGSPPPRNLAFRYLPLLFHAFPEGLFIVGADDANRDLVGARLISLGGVPADEAYARVRGATSAASDTEALWTVPIRMADMRLLEGLGFAVRDDSVAMVFERIGGARVERTIAGLAESPRAKLPAPPGVDTTAYLRETGEAHRFETWPDANAVHIQFNQVADDPDETLAAFGLRLREALADPSIRAVIVDLRHNNGGNSFAYRELMRTLIAFSTRPDSRLYVIIGRGVYSAAANFATDLERFADPVFVGEPTSMTGNQDGDEGAVVLPNSGLRATVSGVRWQLSHPWDERRSIAPHVPVTQTAADHFAGRDRPLDVARALIAADRD